MSKKLLFITKLNFALTANSGLVKKINGQVSAFRQHGFEVHLLNFYNNNLVLENGIDEKTLKFEGKFARIKLLMTFFLCKGRFMNFKGFSGLYIRHFLLNPLFLYFLFTIKRKNPGIKIVLEFPTFPYKFEYRKKPFTTQILVFSDLITSRFLRFFVNRALTFSREDKIYKIPTIITDNGISVDKTELLQNISFSDRLNLLGLANVQTWHGFDRVIRGLAAFKNSNSKVDVVFHIAGTGDALEHLMILADKYKLNKSVIFYGYISGEKLRDLQKICHLGIASLGMHRIHVEKGNTSPLKSREYAASGFPFVVGYTDHDFKSDFPYQLILPADESIIDISKIVRFYSDIYKNHPNHRLELREYAKENLDWFKKLQIVANFFNDLE
jgi:glycosyltransferase involved in cell wall biosynthesis